MNEIIAMPWRSLPGHPFIDKHNEVRMHRCRWMGCYRAIPTSLYCCAEHWFKIPRHLREELWSGYRKGVLSPQYVAAHHSIQDWIKEHYEKSNGHRADSTAGYHGG